MNKQRIKEETEALNIARRKLNEFLGDEKSAKYFGYVKQWLLMKISMQEYYNEGRELLSPDNTDLHSNFLLAMLNRVDGLIIDDSPRFSRDLSPTPYENTIMGRRRISGNTIYYVPPTILPRKSDVEIEAAEVYQKKGFPYQPLVFGRFLLAAWENGLETVEDVAADIIVVATQRFLKKIIRSVLTQRNGNKMLTNETNYLFDGYDVSMGLQNKTSKLYGSSKFPHSDLSFIVDGAVPSCSSTINEADHSAADEINNSEPTKEPKNYKLTMEDFYHTLQINRNLIACHLIYAVNMERMALRLNRPNN